MILVLDNVQPALVRLVAGLANAVSNSMIALPPIVITHAWDGQHKEGSFHKKYGALDVRTHNLSKDQRIFLLSQLHLKFPRPRFDVLLEDDGKPNEHIHIEDNYAITPVEETPE